MSAPPPSGWADDRLMKAYDAAYSVQKDFKGDEGLEATFDALLAAIEDADEAIVKSARGICVEVVAALAPRDGAK